MNCRDVHNKISAYLDGELSQPVRDGLFDHMADCEACRDLVGELSFTEAIVATTLKRPMHAPASIRMNVLSAISREAVRPAPVSVWRRAAWRPATAFAATLALAVAGFHTYSDDLPVTAPDAPTSAAQPAVVANPEPVKSNPKPPAPQHKPGSPGSPVPSPAPSKPGPQSVRTIAPKRDAVAVVAPPIVKAKPAAPPAPAATAVDDSSEGVTLAAGMVTNMSGPVLLKNGNGEWEDFSNDSPVKVSSHLKTSDDSVITLQLNDGTQVKSNASTEFEVLRSPTKSEPRWVFRLIRGEIFVSTATDVKVEAPGVAAQANIGQFSVRSTDGEDTAIVVTSGNVTARNNLGGVALEAKEGTSISGGQAPKAPFYVDDPKGQLDWAYQAAAPYNPLDSGGTQS